jgi:hypothetical protein
MYKFDTIKQCGHLFPLIFEYPLEQVLLIGLGGVGLEPGKIACLAVAIIIKNTMTPGEFSVARLINRGVGHFLGELTIKQKHLGLPMIAA